MRVRCWKCRGRGRVRDEGLFEDTAFVLFTAGVGPLVRALVESDPDDDRWWHWCEVCGGYGYQETDRRRADP